MTIIHLALLILQVFQIVLFIYMLMSWMIMLGWSFMRPGGFGFQIYDSLHKLITPMLEPIRRIVPNFGPFDLSFMILFFLVLFLQSILVRLQ